MTYANLDIGDNGEPLALEVWCEKCRDEAVLELHETAHAKYLRCQTCSTKTHEERQ